MNETQTTLREQIENAVNEVEQAPVETKVESTPEPQVKADRVRDESGKFTRKEESKDQNVEVEVKRPQRPSSWKKDYWEHWDKLDPKVAEYISQREQEFSKGVSTYKTEADRAKEIFDAIAPYQQYINIRGGNVKEVISNLLQTANAFNSSDPQSRLNAILQIAKQFDVPLHQAFQADPNQNQYIAGLVNKLNGLETEWKNFHKSREEAEFQQLSKEVDAFGKNHEHLEQVRETMAGLLQAGLADDLESAYQSAIRMPKHSEIFDSIQAQKLAKDEERKKEEAAKIAANARAKVVSPKSSTPVGVGKSTGSKGLRAALEEAVDERFGRV